MINTKRIILMIAVFVLFLPVVTLAGTVDLPKTGQTTCYDAGGAVIACLGTGQDGDLQMGIPWPPQRFTDNLDGTVIDNLTGLIWLKDGNCFGLKNWATALSDANGLTDGTCGLTDSSAAGDWRLPNVNELESLINAGESNPATWLSSQGFTNVQSTGGDYYWSSTTSAVFTSDAWIFYMWAGYTDLSHKTFYNHYIWPVRGSTTTPAQLWKTGQTTSFAIGDDGDLQMGVAWPSPRFTDNLNGTVTDNLTGLIWTQEVDTGPAGCNPTSKKWQEALDYVACLNTNSYLGYTDWRLPNRKELHSLKDFSQYYPALPSGHPFINLQMFYTYWSSTTYADTTNYAWPGDIGIGKFTANYKNNWYDVWPVRDGSVATPGKSMVRVFDMGVTPFICSFTAYGPLSNPSGYVDVGGVKE